MSKSIDRMNRRRLRSSNFTVVVSISLVLFLLGLFALIVVNSNDYAEHLKNQFEIEAYFKEAKDSKEKKKEPEVQQAFVDSLKTKAYVKNVKYIDKATATGIAKQQLGLKNDDLALFEDGIFPPSVVITVRPSYVDSVRIDSITKVLSNYPIIDKVNNTSGLAGIYKRIDNIIFWLIALAALFLIISIILINNSLRLKIFSKRFTIKTMQLVGAKRRFIVKPFLIQSFWLGLLGSILSLVALGGLWYYAAPKLNLALWHDDFIYIIAGVILVGVLIAILSTFFASWRYLKLRTDQLYYL
ncbi:FtsX-like permease family protein [Ornithobacterium rhinotracheale]|uniref:cell division protein FtsX n=1 Tax=Ornithobacterium rhinotracheale TaxID=28251 RepID=UPI00129C3DE3|nr:permease-like cell division protein FtsX [Ornithobacterium rhinotracheale]MRJ07768.1 FtsX-like permease family protein [Ornithobacterium rhinotracheale]MRJ11435.1 FtsX-like permease family protein [Ornithobacterium rhinotracheale]UOH78711.1 permease-like cell division protein FtsX [Ornithobacterium rhinotracheale]